MRKNLSCQFCGNELEKGTKVCPHCGSKVKKPFYKKWWVWLQSATAGQKNALKSAQQYLRSSAFSHDGLIKQLEFEQYSTEDATWAADNCGADWNEQAVASAKIYLSSSAFSYSGLAEQLEFEGFTAAQATYGVDNCGADWNEQAVKCAKAYLSMSPFSRQGLIDQLVFEGFTSAQAEYGVTQNGL